MENDAVHAHAYGGFDIFGFVIGEDALWWVKVVAVEEALVDGWFWFDGVYFGWYDVAVEETEDVILAHGVVYFAAPVGESVEVVAFTFELG